MPPSSEHGGTSRATRRRWFILGAVVIAVAGVVVLALFQPWKLWVDDTVNEAAPVGAVPITAPSTTTARSAPAASATSPSTTSSTSEVQAAPATTTPPLTTPPTPPTSAAPSTIVVSPATVAPSPLGGEFIGIDHGTTGTVVLLEDAAGGQFVRLQDLDTSNGPDLFVYLSTNPPDGPEGEFDDDYVDLGRLEGNVGSSNYAIPAGTDLSRFASVVIWCDRFNSAFGAAPLR
jgi:Electron transfer DM13